MDEQNNDGVKEYAPTVSHNSGQTNSAMIPMAIVVAGFLIAAAIVYSNKSGAPTPVAQAPSGGQAAGGLDAMRATSMDDHLLGNPEAPVKIIEFSDLECPFCKRFHETMKQAMNEYGKKGQIAWIYRNYPIPQLHPKAPHEAEAAECAAVLGGNQKFWSFIDHIFTITPSNNGLDDSELGKTADLLGLNHTDFQACLDSGKTKARIAADITDAGNTGVQGTPYSVVVAANGKKFEINGAQPYDVVKQTIEKALAEK